MSQFSLLSRGRPKPGDDLGSSEALSSSSGQLGSSAAQQLATLTRKRSGTEPYKWGGKNQRAFLWHSQECCEASQSNRGHLLEAPLPHQQTPPSPPHHPLPSPNQQQKTVEKPPAEIGSFFRCPVDSEERLPPAKPRSEPRCWNSDKKKQINK